MKKNIYFILADEILFHTHYFKNVINKLNFDKYNICGITLTKGHHKRGFLYFLKIQFELWGWSGISTISFLTLLKNMLNVFKRNKSIKNIALNNNIPVIESYDVNSEEHLEYLRQKNVDIIISSNGQIFKEELLNLPAIACINRHTALLPKYGGLLPVFWAMFNNETQFGVSIHYMVKEIDKGDILSQVIIPINKKNSLFYNYILGFDESVKATLLALQAIEEEKVAAKYYKNNKEYFRYPGKKNVDEFKKMKGLKTFSFSDLFFYIRNYGV